MRRACGECGRPVFVRSETLRWFGSAKGVASHDLCQRCFKSLASRVIAARLSRKPAWAVRDSLKVLEEQAATGKHRMQDNA